MGCLAEDLDGFDLAPAADQVLQVEGELGIELAIGKHRWLVSALGAGRPGSLSLMGSPALLRLLGVLGLVLAWLGGSLDFGAGSKGRLNLGGLVRCGPGRKFVLITLGIRKACVARFESR